MSRNLTSSFILKRTTPHAFDTQQSKELKLTQPGVVSLFIASEDAEVGIAAGEIRRALIERCGDPFVCIIGHTVVIVKLLEVLEVRVAELVGSHRQVSRRTEILDRSVVEVVLRNGIRVRERYFAGYDRNVPVRSETCRGDADREAGKTM